MGVMPMKEDDGVQELYTRDHGTVKVDKLSWQDGGFHIVKSPNGAYCHNNNLPIRDEKEIHAAFGRNEDGTCSNEEAKQKCLKWFRTRHEQLENPVRPVMFHSDGYPIFADGSVPDFDDLYSFFKPGPILTAAIVSLQDYKKRKESGKPPPELRKAAPPEVAPETMESPVHKDQIQVAKEREETSKRKAREKMAKARAARKVAAPKAAVNG